MPGRIRHRSPLRLCGHRPLPSNSWQVKLWVPDTGSNQGVANFFFDPVQVIGNQYNQALSAMAGAERYFRLIDLEPEWKDAPTAKALPPIRGRVEFEEVQFEYERGRPVLTDITFVAEPGETVALVGHTG